MSMGASLSPLLNYKSNPHAHQTPTPLSFVCWWCRWWSPPPIHTPTQLLLFFIFCGVPHFTFLVSSQSVPTNSTTLPSPPPPLFLNTTTTHKNKAHFHFNLKLALAIAVPAVFLTLLIVMAFLKFFRFWVRRKRVSDRVVVVVPPRDNNDDDGHCLNFSCKSGVKDGGVGRVGWEEIQRVTLNFSMSRVIGSGGFSTVYLAQFSDSSFGAVKIQCSSERLNQVYKQELQILLSLRHQNIVKLLGYCDDREEGVLVFEYISNGTLQEKLHGSTGRATAAKPLVLPWKSRMAIAFQLAQAIEYLHEKCSLHIVHGDIKASNILLDENLNCKLCDFGSAKMGFSSTVLPPSSSTMSRMIMGSQGYLDPHYLKTGIASKKNDIYSFGVILLELITGREAFCSKTGEKLTSVAGPLLNDAAKVGEMVDMRLNGDFDLEEAKAMASISARCLSNSPSLRVSVCDILIAMMENAPSISFLTDERLSICTKG